MSIEQAIAAPFATRQLADLGSRVIKVERPGEGDFARHYDDTVLGESSYFVWVNRSKESLTLDIKCEAGQRILADLLATADVFVQNLGPGAVRRLGLDAATLCARHPRLIACDVSGYGNSGPWANRKAYDMVVQCEAGLVSLTGTPDYPSRAGVPVADIAAGMYAYSGILTALYRRATTGQGSIVEVALFESLAEWMSAAAYYTRYGGTPPQRAGVDHPTIAPYGAFETSDGVSVMLAVQNEREWTRLCDVVLGDSAIADDIRFSGNSARVENRPALHELLCTRFRTMDSTTAVSLLDQADIANARLNTIEGLLEHPSLRGRDRWRTVGSPGGPIEALLPPVGLDGVTPRMDPVPSLGEHTEKILFQLGIDAHGIAELRAAGTI